MDQINLGSLENSVYLGSIIVDTTKGGTIHGRARVLAQAQFQHMNNSVLGYPGQVGTILAHVLPLALLAEAAERNYTLRLTPAACGCGCFIFTHLALIEICNLFRIPFIVAEIKKVSWLIALVLASVFLIQHFEMPYRENILSWFSSGKAPYNFADADHRKDSIAPGIEAIDISPSVGHVGNYSPLLASEESARIALSPSELTLETAVSPSQSVYAVNVELGLLAPATAIIPKPQKAEEDCRASASSEKSLLPWRPDQELSDARIQIQNAAIIQHYPGLSGSVFRNLSSFVRSYEIMEQKLKIYVYRDGERPVFHQPKLKGIYSSEGWFMKLLEENSQFVTKNPAAAHLFYLPFSSQRLVDFVYVPNSHSFDDIINYMKNYLDMIKGRYPFWNRTDGEDHFLVACHDWAPVETRKLMRNCIRALCNTDLKEGFQIGKDVSLPETFIHSSLDPLQDIGGRPPSQRKILAFFAGRMHGYLRPLLLKHWENKDPDMKILGRTPYKKYVTHMKESRYCICAKGYEVNSPRVVEAIRYECVPVIISDGFVPPFSDVLNWESFAVFVPEKDIPKLKDILVRIAVERYLEMQRRVKLVRQHFLWHSRRPLKYDNFHMILHSIWYSRVLRS